MFNASLLPQFLHMLLAAYIVSAGLVVMIYARGWLRGRRDALHSLGLRAGIIGLAIAAPLQLVSGDFAVRNVARAQPAKLAAMELLVRSGPHAPYTLGGFLVDGKIVGGIDIPSGLSVALHGSTSASVTGLDAVPLDQRPSVNVVRTSFQLMIAAGTFLVLVALLAAWVLRRRRRTPDSVWLLRGLVLAGPAALLALEAGWTTTEVGRQPWIVHGVLRVASAVTPRGHLGVALVALLLVYTGMTATAIVVIRRMSARWRQGLEAAAPYEPAAPTVTAEGPP
jgi:cytochrome d ubiquinol oxidase subunit I